ncbi:MAG: ABC transporter ATP-binding protein [Elusimicrobiota bacterium]
MRPVIALNDVTRSFGRKKVLAGVTATAAPGKVVGLLGRNGVGKTTLFKIMLDMLATDAGEVEVLGMRPDGTGAIRQKVGYVPERPAFHDFMTVGEVFGLRARFFKGWRMDKALAMAKQMELPVETSIRGASKGTLGKTAWVCAAAHDPELFLLDEPTSGLDALVREDVLSHMIGELHDSGKSILVANHRMEELSGVLDEIWVLANGAVHGVHQVETLRTQACRITGRLKEGARLPAGMPVAELPAAKPLTELIAFEKAVADMLAASGIFENIERTPVPLEQTLKFLLKKTNGGSHD